MGGLVSILVIMVSKMYLLGMEISVNWVKWWIYVRWPPPPSVLLSLWMVVQFDICKVLICAFRFVSWIVIISGGIAVTWFGVLWFCFWICWYLVVWFGGVVFWDMLRVAWLVCVYLVESLVSWMIRMMWCVRGMR